MASRKQRELENTVDNVMDKFFSNSDQKPQEEPEATEKPKAKRTTTKQTKADTGQSEKPKQKVFSFWADVETQKEWRAYAEIKRLSVSDLGRKAISEYISRHKLTEDEQKLYDWILGKK